MNLAFPALVLRATTEDTVGSGAGADKPQGESMIAKSQAGIVCTARLSLAVAALILSTPAFADSIDGDWCSGTLRRIVIDGSQITAPKGAKLTGDYRRYTVLFAMPGGEPDAGQAVNMRFLRQEGGVVQVTIGEGKAEIWRRCPAGIS